MLQKNFFFSGGSCFKIRFLCNDSRYLSETRYNHYLQEVLLVSTHQICLPVVAHASKSKFSDDNCRHMFHRTLNCSYGARLVQCCEGMNIFVEPLVLFHFIPFCHLYFYCLVLWCLFIFWLFLTFPALLLVYSLKKILLLSELQPSPLFS